MKPKTDAAPSVAKFWALHISMKERKLFNFVGVSRFRQNETRLGQLDPLGRCIGGKPAHQR